MPIAFANFIKTLPEWPKWPKRVPEGCHRIVGKPGHMKWYNVRTGAFEDDETDQYRSLCGASGQTTTGVLVLKLCRNCARKAGWEW